MKKIILFVSIVLLACEDPDDNTVCGKVKPVEELEWLKEDIQQIENLSPGFRDYFYISKASYIGGTVILFPNCCPFCSTAIPVKNCAGETIGYVGDKNFSFEILNRDEVLWTPQPFSCSL